MAALATPEAAVTADEFKMIKGYIEANRVMAGIKGKPYPLQFQVPSQLYLCIIDGLTK